LEKTVTLASETGANETDPQSGLMTLGLLSLVAGAVAGLVTPYSGSGLTMQIVSGMRIRYSDFGLKLVRTFRGRIGPSSNRHLFYFLIEIRLRAYEVFFCLIFSIKKHCQITV
jgi:hypothetical protein